MIVTYERISADPAPIAAGLFRFLGVSDDNAVFRECVVRTSFKALSGGCPAGVAPKWAFFRKGVVGDWHSTLSTTMNDMILKELYFAADAVHFVDPDHRFVIGSRHIHFLQISARFYDCKKCSGV